MTEFERTVFDVAIVGAGPAGSATARWLALRGWHVALLERSCFDAPRVGESLPPNVQEQLRELGVWNDFLALQPLPSWGTMSVWGDDAQYAHAHLFNPYGCGWHVDRRAFDELLANAAEAAGVSVLRVITLQRAEYAEDGWWLQSHADQRQEGLVPRTLRARVLIDATGRRAQIARSLGARRILFDHLVGVAVNWAGIDAAQQNHLLVEAVREGWWYSAPLPADTTACAHAVIVMLMTDADLCRRLGLSNLQQWQDVLSSSHATRARLERARPGSAPRVYSARSHRVRRDVASDPRPWLAVGDASLSLDPISGNGVIHALRTARSAADVVSEILDKPQARNSVLAEYEAARDEECTKYLLERAVYYAAEDRFDSPFWRRRRVMAQL